MHLTDSKIAIFLLLILISTADGFWRRRRRRRSPPPPAPVDTTPPTFSNCPSPWTVTVPTTSTRVTWTEPTARDDLPVNVIPQPGGHCSGAPGFGPPGGGFCPPILDFDATISRSGPPSGSTFTEGSHSVVYTARDARGNTATCVVSFTVVTIRCPSIGASPQRSVTCSNSNIASSTCRFSCVTGYDVMGSASLTCLSSGSWSGSFPTCQIRVCGEPPTPSHGSKSCTSFEYGATCTFDCDDGYTISGSSSRVCDGTSWSGTPASCRDTQAPSFSTCPSSIVVNNDDRVTSAVVTYATPTATDNSGSAPSISKTAGQNSGTSFSSGTHEIRYRATDGSGNHADCSFSVTVRVVSCAAIPSQNGRTASCPIGTLKGATCTFSCGVGFTMSGTATVTCNSNGDWNRGFPNCNGISCPQLSAPSSGSISSCSRSFRSSCTFTCNTGYELIGSASRQCSHSAGQAVGFWTGSQPRCQIKTCPFPSVSGGLRDVTRSTCQVSSQNTVNYGSVCEYACATGFRMTGDHLRTCGPSGSWTQPLPVCHVITCALNSLPVPTNGVRTGCSGSSVSFGDSCSLSCNRGYRPTTPTRRTCQDNGSGQGVWSGGTITCSIVNCSPLSAPPHGRITGCRRGGSSVPVTSPQPFDTSCAISCNTGYTLTSGPASRTCLTSGQWDGQATVCTDETPPTVQCPADVTIYAGPGQTSGSPTWEWEPLRASDASGSYTATLSEVDGQPVSSRPSSFDEGSHTLTYSVTDSSGNRASCSFDVTIQVVRCSPLETPNHATITGQGCSTTSPAIRGTTCQARCDRGYERTSGDPERTCTQDGSNPTQGYWSGTQTQCTAVQCILPTLSHGSVSGCSGSFISYQESCHFTCDVGYRTPAGESSRTRTCQADRSLSGQAFDCTVQVTCPSLQVPSHGAVAPTTCTSTSSPYSTTCLFTCEGGYDLSGPSRVECLDSASWSDTRSTTCSDTEDPVFAGSCPKNIDEIADRGQTTWTGQIESPTATDNSGQVTVQRQEGSTSSAAASYPEGITSVVFEAVDSAGNTAVCTVNLNVEVKRCSNLEHPAGGAVQSCTNYYGSTCRISCNTGYELSSGSAERTCELDSSRVPFWSGSDSVCTIRRCPVVVPPENALPSSCGGTVQKLATFGSVCSFYCPHGYNPRGQNTVSCQADGTWSEASFVCEAITCPRLDQPGVTVTPSDCQGTPRYGQQCVFSCPPGFTVSPISSVQVTCLGSGQWSGTPEEVQCRDTASPNFGSCPPTEDLTFYTDPATGTATVTWSVSATDNSAAPLTIICDPERGSSLAAGTYPVTCVARDGGGNERQCLFDIKVRDRTCPPLSPPFNGVFTSPCFNVEGATCTISCNEGYRLVGSSVASCQTVNGETSWVRDSSPICEAITCDSLPSFDVRGSIHPFFCRSPSTPFYGSVCDIGCTDRYTLVTDPVDAPPSVECLQDGSWTYNLEESYTCSDKVIPEVLYCPPPISVSRTDAAQPVVVYFDFPLAVDNSEEDIQPVLSPSVTPPIDVNQDTTIYCLFQDSAGNQNDQCHIEIVVIDDVPPVIVRPCPSDQELTASTKQTRVFWEEPQFEDPGGKHVIVSSNYEPGSKFAVGSYVVRYSAVNEITGRRTECQFNVNVRLESCPTLETPANGVLACHESNEGQVCVLSCLPGYRSSPQLTTFVCNILGKWQPSRVADCGAQRRPPRSTVPVKASYDASDCSKAGQAPAIASAFLDQLLMTQFSALCSGTSGCSVDDIKVTCGPIDTRRSRGRGRRQAEDGERLFWTFEIDIGVDVIDDELVSDAEAVQVANATLLSLANDVGSFIPPVVEFPETVGGSTSFVPDSVEVEDVVLKCEEGFAPNLLYSECVACVAGSFFNEDEKDCHPCPTGSYQDEERQTECKVCPEGTSTDGEGAKGLDECYDLCPAGTFSPDGLFSCRKCDVGFYQPALGQETCLSCPAGQTTSTVGAISISECTGPCQAGTSSPSGLEPCTPCPQRYYQPNIGQRFCLICDGRKTTEGVGSISQSQCIDINHCSSEPCQNGGRCLSLLQRYICRCPAGFKGQNCEVNVNECERQPCRNGGTCVDGINSFQCFCTDGFEGPDCSININECDPEPCANGGTCQDGLGTFICHCPATFEGPHCETERDPCSSGPCLNDGTCERSGWDYDCICSSGFTGRNCNTRVSPCYRRPCRNGDCTDTEDGQYRCLCYSGFTGEHCDIAIDFCANLVCNNGGSCVQTTEGATCICPTEYAGETCDHLRTICDDEKCENGATCNLVEISGQRNEYSCECVPGFTGRHCETNIDECASMPCSSQATCHDLVDGYRCECPAGYEGINCETETNECESSPCAEGSTCIDEVARYHCLCQPGKTGPRCSQNIDYCRTAQCLNGALCVNELLGHRCICTEGYTGVSCETNINDCQPNPCSNSATCEDGVASFVCHCPPGYTGTRCETDINECENNHCENGATCVDLVGSYTCECAFGYEGDLCSVITNYCISNPCSEGSTCEPLVGEFRCLCIDGYTGEVCDQEIQECNSNPCQHGATCVDLVASYQCLCADGYTGTQCEIEVNECAGEPCQHGGCIDMVAGYTCECLVGYSGTDCEVNIDDCIQNSCQNGASCLDGIAGYTCLCPQDWTGQFCEDFIPCLENPCQNGGDCKQDGGFRYCSCLDGFAGSLCETNINDCELGICRNGGECIDLVNDFVCECRNGFSGDFCEIDEDDCLEEPCQNYGSCVDGPASYTCICQDGYTGETCEEIVDPCIETPCQNGGTCYAIGLISVCECPSGYRGNRCEMEIDECAVSPCLNFGICVDKVNDYECLCLSAFAGRNCQIKLPGNADLKFDSSENDGFLVLQGISDDYQLPFIKLGYWFNSVGNADDFVLFEYASEDFASSELRIKNISHLTVELFGDLIFELSNRNLSDGQWHNLLLTVAGNVSFEMAIDGVLLENKTLIAPSFHFGGRARIGFPVTEKAAQVIVSGAHIWSYSGSDVSSPCQPEDSGDILSWEQILAVSQRRFPGHVFTPSQCDDTNECLEQPCFGSATCVDLLHTFQCLCPEGFTGDTCDEMIDFCRENECQNQASCVGTSHNYTCMCPQDYTGTFCHIPVVHGGWGEWTVWDPCTVTCGGGTKVRTRECNNPPPENGGSFCEGPSVERHACNSDSCPSCPVLTLPLHVNPSCIQTIYGELQCSFYCTEGYVFSVPPADIYICGPDTDFLWSDSEYIGPSLELPQCVGRVRRSAVQSTVHVSLPGLSCQSVADELEIRNQLMSRLSSRKKDIPCLNREHCFIKELSIFNCGTSSSTTSSSSYPFAVIHLSQNSSTYSPEQNGGNDDGLHDSLQESINVIKELMRQKQLDFWFNGEVMALDNSTVNVDGWDICPPGTIESSNEGYCYPCQPGTYRSYDVQGQDLECELCPLNSYQESEATDVCIPCPAGQRTLQKGSRMKSDCLGPVEYDAQRRYLVMEESYETDVVNLSESIIIILACLTFLVACVIIAVVSRSRKVTTRKLLVDS